MYSYIYQNSTQLSNLTHTSVVERWTSYAHLIHLNKILYHVTNTYAFDENDWKTFQQDYWIWEKASH